jgi:hypothetical protein
MIHDRLEIVKYIISIGYYDQYNKDYIQRNINYFIDAHFELPEDAFTNDIKNKYTGPIAKIFERVRQNKMEKLADLPEHLRIQRAVHMHRRSFMPNLVNNSIHDIDIILH